MAYTQIQTFALLEESKGSNWLCCRTKEGPIRTVSQIPMLVKIPSHQALSIYQVLAPKIKELKALGLSNEEIASKLKINKKTVRKAFFRLYPAKSI